MRELLIATRNDGKLPEIRRALRDLPFRIIDINDVPALLGIVPHEQGSTYEENATIKAREYGARAQMLTLADDSGIEVDALGGLPGVQSASYAPGTDADRNTKLLDAMKDVSEQKRTACFVTVIAIYDPMTDTLRTCRATSRGRITRAPKGSRPFGYDPVFFYDDAGKTGGEMGVEEKEAYSSRGRALAKASEILVADFA